jgi:hypothetical protein
MQQAVSITEPDYGVIFDDIFLNDDGRRGDRGVAKAGEPGPPRSAAAARATPLSSASPGYPCFQGQHKHGP